MRFRLLTTTLLLTVAAAPIQAEETASGCGIGSEVLEGKSGKGSHIAAAILNTALVPNTFFMTTGDGILGCDPTQTVERDVLTETFVAGNFDQLSIDAAMGGGTHLEVLASLLDVEPVDRAAFMSDVQRVHGSLFGGDTGTVDFVKRLADASSVVPEISTTGVTR